MKKVLNIQTIQKLKRKGFVAPKVFDVMSYPSKSIHGFIIKFHAGDKDWYLDHDLKLNSNYHCAGIWTTEQKAHLFIVKNFYD